MGVFCPYCYSSRIVWDDVYGNMVCTSCGAVIEEHLIDDRPLFEKDVERQRRACSRGVSRSIETLLAEDAEPDPLASVVNKKALEVLRENRDVYEILVEISRHPLVKSRKLRVRVALALYVYLRLQGYSKSRAVLEASRRAGASHKSLERLVRGERALVESLEAELSLKRVRA